MSLFVRSVLFVAVLLGSSGLARAADPPKTIVLVHGAFADSSSWDRVVPLLEAKGYNVVSVYDPMSSLSDDAAATKRFIDAQPGPVLLVGHSYGGAVITVAGANDKVVGLVYVAAFAPDAGESVNDLGKGQPPPPWAAALKVDSGGFASLPTEVVLKYFAPDVPAAEGKLIAVKQGPINTKCFEEKAPVAAWKTKPSWFVLPKKDQMIPPAAQDVMSKRAKGTVTAVDASHVVMLSKPKEVADVILAAATKSFAAK